MERKIWKESELWKERVGDERLDMEARCEINKFIQAVAAPAVLAASFQCPSSLNSLPRSSLLAPTLLSANSAPSSRSYQPQCSFICRQTI